MLKKIVKKIKQWRLLEWIFYLANGSLFLLNLKLFVYDPLTLWHFNVLVFVLYENVFDYLKGEEDDLISSLLVNKYALAEFVIYTIIVIAVLTINLLVIKKILLSDKANNLKLTKQAKIYSALHLLVGIGSLFLISGLFFFALAIFVFLFK